MEHLRLRYWCPVTSLCIVIAFYLVTESGPPENVSLVCRFDNISHTSFVYVMWTPPLQPNGQIMHYNVSKH